MKNLHLLVVILLLFPLFLNAQKTRFERKKYEADIAYYKEILGKKDKDFEVKAAPQEWKTEPVVILCQKSYFLVGNIDKGIIRKRILIQDKAALDDFSEFYYKDADVIGIKHIKAKGSSKDIDFDAAVKVETEVPRFYADSYSSGSYNKIAIPDLEVGDILDYFKVFTDSNDGYMIEAISYSYPVLYQEVIYDLGKEYTGFFDSYNGAPRFKKVAKPGLDAKAKPKKTTVRYILTDSKRAAATEERWDFPYLTEPIYKTRISYTKSLSRKQREEFKKTKGLDIKESLVSNINEGDMSAKILKIEVEKRLRRIGIRKMKPRKQIKVIYNAIRYEFLMLSTSFVSSDRNVMRSLDEYYMLKSNVFAGVFSDLLDRYKIPCAVVGVVPRYFGGISRAKSYKELEFGVYVPTTKKYYWTMDNYRNMDDEYFDVIGAEGYKLDRVLLDKSAKKFKKVTIPTSKAENNTSSTTIDIVVNSDNSMKFNNSVKFTGRYRRSYGPTLMYQTDYMDDDFELLTPEKDKTRIKKKRKKKSTKNSKKANYRLKKKELGKKKTELIEEWLKQDFEVEELEDFGVVSFGRIAKGEPLHAEVSFTSSAYLKKAGPNLIFDIGKLISGQVGLEEEEMKSRTKDVELGYARTIENTIKVTLPAGYKAQGLETLNMKVDNENAAFISVATQEGNILSVKTTKVYKKVTIAKENWSSLVQMLEAAYKFSQQKIILKK